MVLSLWRRLWKSDLLSRQGKELPKSRHLSFRPTLEALEDRTLPAPLVHGILPPAREGSTSARFAPPPPRPIAPAAPGSETAHRMKVTVIKNSPPSVIDLGPLFAQMSGAHPADGLQIALLGNTNPGLVKTELSEGELTLTYTPSRCGTATITVGATDAAGACVRENILVTVLPLPSTKPKASSPIPAGQQMSIPPSNSQLA